MKIGILGSGNGAHAVAFDFARAGYDVYMGDFPQFHAGVAAISEQGGIYAEGEMQGFQKVAYAGHDFETVVKDAKMVLIVATANAAVPMAEACRPYVHPGQIFVVCPGSCFGVIEFKRALGYELTDPSVIVAETSTLPYAARLVKPGTVTIPNRLKGGLFVAALPKNATEEVFRILSTVYEAMRPASSILQTSLQNGNPAIHPAIMLSNLARVENREAWQFYHDGVTLGVGRIIEAVDKERIAIGAACGVQILDDPTLGLMQGYMYDATYDVGYIKSPGFAGIMAPTTADHRYFDEDGNNLCLWEDMGKALGIKTTAITTVINMCSIVRAKDYRALMTKSMKSLGLDQFEPSELGTIL